MTIVLDASAAIEIVLNRSRSDGISAALESSQKVYAPGLYKAEVTNAIWKYLRTKQIEKRQATRALHIALDLVDEYINIQNYTDEVLNESVRLDHSAYGIFYLVAARRTGSLLMSLDKKFNHLAHHEGIETINS